MIPSIWSKGNCSRCSKETDLIWCICKECSDKAQENYRKEVKEWAENKLKEVK